MSADLQNGSLVGVLGSGYPQKRNMLGAAEFGLDFQLVSDRFAVVHKLWHRTSGRGYSAVLHCFAWAGSSDVSLVHSFNALVYGGMPWVVTFETTLPRVGSLPTPVVRHCWRKIARPECRAVLALSQCAARRLLGDLQANLPKVSEAVLNGIRHKLSVLHPPQPTLVDGLEAKFRGINYDGPLRIAMVGHDFYRKGGLEVLLAMDALVSEGLDIVLNIAGKMASGDYASRAGESEVRVAEEIIARHHDRIHRMGSIPSSEVHDLLRYSHLLCLATWGDTYGYSVLEGQAAGCATITSDIRALPEINNEECGWLIKVPKLGNGDGDLDSVAKRERFRAILVEGLKNSLREAHDDRDLLRRKSAASLLRVREHHDPGAHAEKLKELYRRIPK